jgi:hypothetical protein
MFVGKAVTSQIVFIEKLQKLNPENAGYHRTFLFKPLIYKRIKYNT